MELSKLASRIQQERYENFLKPGLTQSRASLKQLSRFNKDKLNYKNEDYERQQMLFRQYRYEEKFKDKLAGEAPAGTFLTQEESAGPALPPVKLKPQSTDRAKDKNLLFSHFEMQYQGTLQNLLDLSKFVPKQ